MKSLQLNPQGKTSAFIHKETPSFKVLEVSENSKGKVYLNSEKYKDKALIIHFWASWCSSCSTDSQILNEIYPSLKRDGTNLLAVAVSDDYESASTQKKRLQKKFLVALDDSGDMALDFGITGVPETFFINKKGELIHRHTGPLSHEILAKYTESLKDISKNSNELLGLEKTHSQAPTS